MSTLITLQLKTLTQNPTSHSRNTISWRCVSRGLMCEEPVESDPLSRARSFNDCMTASPCTKLLDVAAHEFAKPVRVVRVKTQCLQFDSQRLYIHQEEEDRVTDKKFAADAPVQIGVLAPCLPQLIHIRDQQIICQNARVCQVHHTANNNASYRLHQTFPEFLNSSTSSTTIPFRSPQIPPQTFRQSTQEGTKSSGLGKSLIYAAHSPNHSHTSPDSTYLEFCRSECADPHP